MSKRIVDDPSLHGWVDDNGKWVWGNSGGSGISGDSTGAGMIISETEPTDKVEGMQWLNPTTGLVLFWDDEKWLQMPGGVNGADGSGNIADGIADGIVATWDSTANSGAGQWTPDPTVVVSGGKVGIGDSTPTHLLTLNNNTDSIIGLRLNRDPAQALPDASRNEVWIYPEDGAGRLRFSADNAGETNEIQSINELVIQSQAASGGASGIKFNTNGDNTRLTIDAAGDATFSGIVKVESSSSAAQMMVLNATTQDPTSYRQALSIQSSGTEMLSMVTGPNSSFNSSTALTLTTPTTSVTFDNVTDKATFTGTVNAEAATFSGVVNTKRFIASDGGTTRLDLIDTSNALGKKFLRSNTGRFDIVCHDYSRAILVLEDNGNGYVTGTWGSTRLIQDGSPVIDAKGLIKTLSTLRNATKDETTLEGLRDSIGNAIGGLIEEFENQIATMPAEDES